MRYSYLVVAMSVMLLAAPAWAGDEYSGFRDGTATQSDPRRPDLGITGPAVRGTVEDGVSGALPSAGDSSWEEFYVCDVDTAAFMGRLYEVLTREEWLGQFPEVVAVTEYLKTSGIFNLSNVHQEYAATGDNIHFRASKKFADMDPESYIARLLALPDAELRSAAHVTDDYLLYFASNNVTEMLLLEMDQMLSSAEMVEALGGEMDGMEELQQGLAMMEAFQVDQILKNVVTGEMAMVLYGLPPLGQLVNGEVEPSQFDMAIMIGIKDSTYLVSMIDQYGAEVGLMPREHEGDPWHYYTLQGEESLGLMFNDELLLVTTNLDAARDHVAKALPDGGQDIGACQYFLSVNLDKLRGDVVEPLAGMAMEEFDDDIVLPLEPLGYLFNITPETELGSLEIEAHFQGDGASVECRMNKSVVQYLVFGLGLAACGAAQSGAFN